MSPELAQAAGPRAPVDATAQAHNELRLQSSLTDESLAHLAPLQRLEELSLKSCAGLQGPGLRYLVALPNLHRLDLQACIRLTNKGARPASTLSDRSSVAQWADLACSYATPQAFTP